ncbi:phenylalanine--tRNA ligase subunit beta [Pseudonocardia spinosispora]|uniref:phenylalanine--tRNA ligase subunit beta n=1 Tax=Pseudonocardia spinosispora TaxID=103441 RepID=UPI00041ED4CB|nr:phenylalanine--tRNA ligase subunit beta [Pseudonocardia spinosispora]
MRVSVSWLADLVELPDGITAEEIADAFVRVGLEVEEIHSPPSITGPLRIGRVQEIEELTGLKKPIRYCQVEVGEIAPRGIICGATNFEVGDLVAVALPGTVLPGDFTITARKTYGHVSDGMICSVLELGLGSDHAGILVLPPGTGEPGDDAAPVLGLGDPVIELAVTPDRGYCFSVRGLARELACSLDTHFGDPAHVGLPEVDGEAWPVRIDDEVACRRFVARRVTGVDPSAPSPWWMRRRLIALGVRPISLAVDVTNYVMMELGQPLHAYDATALRGPIVVRRASAGEKLTTLDGSVRALDQDDLLITDSSGPIGLAGVMGGATTEISEHTHDVLLESANFEPAVIARAARRHKLPSEASRRFERAVDTDLGPFAAERAASLLVQYGGGSIGEGRTDVGDPPALEAVAMPLEMPDRVAGIRYERGVSARRLGQIGCAVELRSDTGNAEIVAVPPTWRPDLRAPSDLVEEVLRLEGLDSIPSVLPAAAAGRGLTTAQRRRRSVSRTLAEAGYTEVLPFPFISGAVFDQFGCAEDDVRRRTLRLLNPIDADRPEMASTLLPGLFDAAIRNVARGMTDVALFHIGQVVLPKQEQSSVPDVPVDRRPSDEQIEALLDALPEQPVHVAAVLAGQRERAGWWGDGRAASWADAVEAAHLVAEASGVELRVTSATLAPWHPGRCASLWVGKWVVGYAGELHPKVVEALGLPKRTCAMELALDVLPLTDLRPAPVISPFPPVLLDVALVVQDDQPAASVADALREGAGDLLEHLRQFDLYTGDQVGEGKRSLAFKMRLRAPDRTLTMEEATAARDSAVAMATERCGAVVRG